MMDDNRLTTGEFARLLSWCLTAYFWALCLVIGYYIWYEETKYAIVWLLILSLTLPVAVKAASGVVAERHSGTEIDAKDIARPATAWLVGILLLLAASAGWNIAKEVFNQHLL